MDTNVILLSLQLVLPAFNDFAEKAQLDVKLPLEMARATKSNVGKNNRGVLMVFDQRYQFNWHSSTGSWGSINFYDRKFSTPWVDREKMLPWLVKQKSLIGTNEAILIASNCLHRLGFDRPEWVSLPPTITQFTFSPDLKTPHLPLPLFSVRWFPRTPHEGLDAYAFEIQVSGLDRRIIGFGQLIVPEDVIDLSLINTNLSHTAPR